MNFCEPKRALKAYSAAHLGEQIVGYISEDPLSYIKELVPGPDSYAKSHPNWVEIVPNYSEDFCRFTEFQVLKWLDGIYSLRK
jgi:hypothetical protein